MIWKLHKGLGIPAEFMAIYSPSFGLLNTPPALSQFLVALQHPC